MTLTATIAARHPPASSVFAIKCNADRLPYPSPVPAAPAAVDEVRAGERNVLVRDIEHEQHTKDEERTTNGDVESQEENLCSWLPFERFFKSPPPPAPSDWKWLFLKLRQEWNFKESFAKNVVLFSTFTYSQYELQFILIYSRFGFCSLALQINSLDARKQTRHFMFLSFRADDADEVDDDDDDEVDVQEVEFRNNSLMQLINFLFGPKVYPRRAFTGICSFD